MYSLLPILFGNKTKIPYVRAEKLKTLNQKQKILIPWRAVSKDK